VRRAGELEHAWRRPRHHLVELPLHLPREREGRRWFKGSYESSRTLT
jgi:hypothetical protein